MALQIWLPCDNEKNIGLRYAIPEIKNSSVSKTGMIGGSIVMNGSSSYISLSKSVDADCSYFSYSAWVKFNNISSTQCLYSQRTGVGVGFAMFLIGGKIRFDAGGGSSNMWQTTKSLTANTWTHIAVTFDKTDRKKKLYINGTLVESTTASASSEKSVGVRATIGGSESSDNGVAVDNWLNGSICDIRIYDNLLSEKDIKEIYAQKVYELQPQWRHNDGITILGDGSGMGPLTSQTISNVSMSGNSLYFNGTSASNIQMPSIGNSGGTLSIWFNCDKPGNSFLYCDPSSKMALTFYSNGTYLIPLVAGSGKRYSTAGITWGAWNHVATTYDESGAPVQTYINGNKATQSGSDHWTSSEAGYGTIFIGRSNWSTSNVFKGYINEIRVYTHQLTEEQVKEIYHDGPVPNKWETRTPALEVHEESGATWLKLLRHDNPTAQIFTAANCKNNEQEGLFSKLYLLDDDTLFLRPNGTYEFMEKQKCTPSSAEWVGRWTQTSSPTASTATGFNKIYTTTDAGSYLTLGLHHTSSNAQFDRNGSDWWCATGAYNRHNNGLPGYQTTVITTGYQEFFVRIDGTKFMEL